MPDYRCYPLRLAGSIDGPAQIINSSDDASAIAKAYSMFAGRAFEVWQGAHKVYATKSRPSISARTLGE